MISTLEKKWIQFFIIFGTVSVSLFITPSFSSEPVDVPKLLLLVTFAGLIFGLISPKLSMFIRRPYRIIALILGVFLAQLTLVLFFSGAPFNQQFFGTFGRNTGFLAYFALSVIFVATVLVSTEKLVERVNNWLFLSGLATVIYGFLQNFKHDPIKWNNPYNPIIAFLGNPDFASAFLGFSSVAGFAIFFKSAQKIQVRLSIVFYQFCTIYLIVKSHAQQGLLVYALTIFLFVIIYLYSSKKFNTLIPHALSVLFVSASVVAILGIFKVGPLASHLYKLSVRQRGFYWHAAIKMMSSNPIFGIGLDSYGDNYFKYRSANAAFFSMPTQSNAAHNVFLDMAASGGFILLLAYLCLTVYALVLGIKNIRKMDTFDPFFVALFTAWVGYQAQSIISINNLGLAIWGWVLGGAVIGMALNQKEVVTVPTTNQSRKKIAKKIDLKMPTLGLVLGALLAFPPFIADHNYRVAAASQNANILIASASKYPEDLQRTLSIAQTLAASKIYPQALQLAQHVVSVSPKNYNAWVLISQLTPPNSSLHEKSIVHLKTQNPQDKSIK
jgi:O-antigen ligase